MFYNITLYTTFMVSLAAALYELGWVNWWTFRLLRVAGDIMDILGYL
jgi:hypothetical protein